MFWDERTDDDGADDAAADAVVDAAAAAARALPLVAILPRWPLALACRR